MSVPTAVSSSTRDLWSHQEGIALQSFNGSIWGEEYLNFTQGERLVLVAVPISEEDAGWAYGSVGQDPVREGWFPPTYWAAISTSIKMCCPETQQFVNKYLIEDWIGIALDMLSPNQREKVMYTPGDFKDIRNMTAVTMSRIYMEATPKQRVEIYIQLNNIDHGLSRLLRGMSPSEQSEIMDHKIKMKEVHNANGVLMSRLKKSRGLSSRSVPPRRRGIAILAAEGFEAAEQRLQFQDGTGGSIKKPPPPPLRSLYMDEGLPTTVSLRLDAAEKRAAAAEARAEALAAELALARANVKVLEEKVAQHSKSPTTTAGLNSESCGDWAQKGWVESSIAWHR